MNKAIEKLNKIKINNTIKALKNNNINAMEVANYEELIQQIDSILNEGATVSCGGSQTLFETGIIDYLRSGKYNFLDRYKPGMSPIDLKELYRKCFYADAYFSSANAITEKGEIFNVDSEGNRVAPILFGPDKVIIIIGSNKIVKNLSDAEERNRTISAPANCIRMERRTPCTKVGKCMDCESIDRICCEYAVIKKQRDYQRMYVFILNESLGF